MDGPIEPVYLKEGKMLFPRMWSSSGDGSYEKFYQIYTQGKGKSVSGSATKKPAMGANLQYFFDYQLNWMYWRYFMWNFVGRQNQIHAPSPGDIFHGNWESGVKFIDNLLLGDQSDAPDCLKNDPGKNHYFFLPLLLGLLGLFFQFDRDKRGCWLNFLMFFMTGIAIVIYLNQPPYQVRERDYAYAGSFYFFSVWIGMAVAAVYTWITDARGGRGANVTAAATGLLFLLVPVEMAAQNWDDHDRSGRRTAVELAYNYLNSVGPDGILVTHGDNDTFPLWYAQEVENVRTDVRICNTSLLGTDWHIDQMTWAMNDSAPLDLSVDHKQYLYGTNEWVPIYDTRDQVMDIHDVMTLFRHPQVKATMSSGSKVDYIASRKISVPVNKENVIKYGILDARFADMIPDSIVLTISPDKEYLTKPEIFMLDLLDNYQWDRPLHVLNKGGDLDMGIKDYLQYVGYSYKFTPIRNKISTTSLGFVDTDLLYDNLMNVFSYDALSADKYFLDHQNMYTYLGVMSIRGMFVNSAIAFAKAGETERALEALDKCRAVMHRFPEETLTLDFTSNDYSVIEMIELYYQLGEKDTATQLGSKMCVDLLETARFYLEFYEWASDEWEMTTSYIYLLADILSDGGDQALADSLKSTLEEMVDVAVGGGSAS